MSFRLLVALALVSGLAGCDAVEVAPSASATLIDFYVAGPASLKAGECGVYTAYASGSNQPVAIQSWSISGSGSLNGGSGASQQVLAGRTGSSFVLSARKRPGSAPFNLTVKVDGSLVGDQC